MKESRKVYGWLVRGGNAAVGCLSMWADTMGNTTVVIYCGNHFGLFLPILSVAVLEMGGRFAIWLLRYRLIIIIGIQIPI